MCWPTNSSPNLGSLSLHGFYNDCHWYPYSLCAHKVMTGFPNTRLFVNLLVLTHCKVFSWLCSHVGNWGSMMYYHHFYPSLIVSLQGHSRCYVAWMPHWQPPPNSLMLLFYKHHYSYPKSYPTSWDVLSPDNVMSPCLSMIAQKHWPMSPCSDYYYDYLSTISSFQQLPQAHLTAPAELQCQFQGLYSLWWTLGSLLCQLLNLLFEIEVMTQCF